MEADQLRAAAEQLRVRVAELEKQVGDLQFADDARAAWRYETAVTRDNAERARHAAAIKGIDLDNPAEQVTAEEWLDVHRAEQLAEDEHREITEDDVVQADEDERPLIRTPPEDHEVVRRAIPSDATTEVVDRAALAQSTIKQRQHEVAAMDEADPAEDDRRDELARWAELDSHVSQHADDAGAADRSD